MPLLAGMRKSGFKSHASFRDMERFSMRSKTGNALLALAALFCGLIAIPIAAFGNWALGLFFLSLPVFLIFATN